MPDRIVLKCSYLIVIFQICFTLPGFQIKYTFHIPATAPYIFIDYLSEEIEHTLSKFADDT